MPPTQHADLAIAQRIHAELQAHGQPHGSAPAGAGRSFVSDELAALGPELIAQLRPLAVQQLQVLMNYFLSKVRGAAS